MEVQAIDGDAFAVAASFWACDTSGAFDQDASHGLGGGGEEVAPVVPLGVLVISDEAEIGFMHECGGLECVASWFVGHEITCQSA